MPILKLRSSDEEVIEVDVEVIRCSSTIRALLDDDELSVLPLPEINSRTLKKALEWADHHKDDKPPAENPDMEDSEDDSDAVDPWDTEFLKIDLGSLLELILGAHYLKMKGLLDLTCSCVAKMMTEKTPEDVRTLFNVKNDFAPSEEQDIRKANDWCEIPDHDNRE